MRGRRVAILRAMHPKDEPVTIEAYSEEWQERYRVERRALLGALAGTIVGLEHIGSTSIPGLAAKPTVDLMLGTLAWPWPDAYDATLATLGYNHYKTPAEDGRWRVYLKPWEGRQRGYHLHVVEHDSEHWLSHLLFRDFLRDHIAEAKRYEALKLELARNFANDRTAYQEGKSQLIAELTRSAEEWARGR